MTEEVAYHLCAADFFAGLDPNAPYAPEGFAREGFIHCTHGIEEVVRVANRYYRDDARSYVVLALDLTRVAAPIVYEDARRSYPHIYGRLEREAIMSVTPVPRLPRGGFLVPLGLTP